MARTDRMGIMRPDSDTRTDTELYGSLFLVKRRSNNVNDYGGNVTDRAKLANITDAAPGSTCTWDDTGGIDRMRLSGWAEFGEEEETAAASNSASPASVNLSPLDINRNDLMNETGSSDIEGTPEEMTVEPIIDNEDMI